MIIIGFATNLIPDRRTVRLVFRIAIIGVAANQTLQSAAAIFIYVGIAEIRIIPWVTGAKLTSAIMPIPPIMTLFITKYLALAVYTI